MTRLQVRRATPADRELLADLLRGLSPDSAYRRFQTGLGPEPGAALLRTLLPDGLRGTAVLAFRGDEVVAHGVWLLIGGGGSTAEIALVVADDHQECGVGTALADALVVDLAQRGVDEVEVFASATNAAVRRMVARHAPDADRERDGATVTYRFRVAGVQGLCRTVA